MLLWAKPPLRHRQHVLVLQELPEAAASSSDRRAGQGDAHGKPFPGVSSFRIWRECAGPRGDPLSVRCCGPAAGVMLSAAGGEGARCLCPRLIIPAMSGAKIQVTSAREGFVHVAVFRDSDLAQFSKCLIF